MVYDPRHTTGLSPVHSDVKHPLVNDPRRSAGSRQLHGNAGRSRSLLGLFIWLGVLLVILAGAILLVFGRIAG